MKKIKNELIKLKNPYTQEKLNINDFKIDIKDDKVIIDYQEFGKDEVLNKDFRYLLTAVDTPAPNLYIEQEIQNNTFIIAGGNPGQKISWQVTGIRKDPYAQAHPIIPVVKKTGNEKGKYL